jgi:FlaA1/EpsC-like NDP-sugar epimerase/lipopolysaccharide/colanic/teichoic acid biosynthesis glycosyltransferase
MKRVVDILVAASGLVLLSPLLAWIAYRVRREDGGPPLFRQDRVGRDGRPFEILKFRTMRATPGPSITAAGDVRITELGRWLRKWKLDELPQLWNVLRGDMSVVGPRPEIPEFVRHYPVEARQILTVRPGITGPAQLEGMDEERELLGAADPERHYREVVLPRKLAIDLRYVRGATLDTDFRILARTAARMLSSALATARGRWFVKLLAGRRPIIEAVNLLLALTSYVLAFSLQTDLDVRAAWNREVLQSLPFLLAARLIAFRHYGLFQGWWKYTGVSDFVDIVKATSLSSAIFVTAVVMVFGAYAVPRSIVLIDWMLLIALLSGSRLASRLFWTWGSRMLRDHMDRAIVVGDLEAVEPLVRDLVDSSDLPLHAVGLVTTTPVFRGSRVHGVPVLGTEEELPRIVETTPADVVLLALSPGHASVLRRVLARPIPPGPAFKIVPPLRDRIHQRLRLRDVRDIETDDLLGRDEVRLDVQGIRETLADRCVLISGAAGSIGSELARQVARHGPSRLVLVDRNERALAALLHGLADAPTHAVGMLSDIRHLERLRRIFAEHRPEVVFHAAAYKHVPMMELNPVEAVKNNVLGTRDLVGVSEELGVRKFVLISTDKAVNPVNIMGSTKRVAERLLDGAANGSCRKIAVRFGNVFGSEGSLVPILLRQIRNGGPVTITHPDATRYFMTIPEAAQLVLQATVLGQGGEIFVLDMGEPVRILDLAVSLIRLAGLTPGRDIEVRITGLRLGERLHEGTLIDDDAVPSAHDKIWVHPPNGAREPIAAELEHLEVLVERYDEKGILEWLRRVAESSEQPASVH